LCERLSVRPNKESCVVDQLIARALTLIA
jgi:hypothetical protein